MKIHRMICKPNVQLAETKQKLLHLGSTDYETVEARGFSGGIWLLLLKVVSSSATQFWLLTSHNYIFMRVSTFLKYFMELPS